MVGFGFGVFLLLLVPACSQSQAGHVANEPQQVEAALSDSDTKFSAGELDELVAPIALYPDALIAQVLPAAVYPLEIVQAMRELDAGGGKLDEEAIKKLDFDVSIRALMHYPEVLKKLNADLDWTVALGDAVVSQQSEVLAAIQRVRSLAQAAGNLDSNDKVRVVNQEQVIVIESSDPKVVYVPRYDPAVVVVVQSSPVVVYSSPVVVGGWMSYGCNWHHGDIDIDVKGFGRYWGRGYAGWGARASWRHNAGRRAAYRHGARAGSRAGWRAGGRTGARAGARAGARTGAVAGRRAGAVSGARAGAAAGRRTGVGRGAATGRRAGNVGSRGRQAGRGNAYGGYRSGRQTASNSRRGSASRGSRSSARRSSASRSSASRSRSSASRSRSSGRSFGGYSSGRSAGRHSSRGSRSRGGGRRGGGRRR